jgi:hypothetical protein
MEDKGRGGIEELEDPYLPSGPRKGHRKGKPKAGSLGNRGILEQGGTGVWREAVEGGDAC